MSSKPKNVHTYIVIVRSASGTSSISRGRYKVGAKTAIEAEDILRKKSGLIKAKTYYKQENDELSYGEIVKEV